MNWQSAFRVIIRVIFIFAYIAFLAASIRHVATFFHNFEADAADWVNPYTLAVSIDLTALVLTVGVMFFRGNMPWYAQGFTWIFIVALTAFSWFVNWEYAMTFQGNDLRVNDTLKLLNPILASSFAFLNLAYSVVAEFFSSKNKTATELAAEVDELELLEAQQVRLSEYRERTRKPSVIQRVKETAIEVRDAAKEVVKSEEPVSSPELDVVAPAVAIPVAQEPPIQETEDETESEDEMEVIEEEFEDIPVALPVAQTQRITSKLPETQEQLAKKPERNTDKLKATAQQSEIVADVVASDANKKAVLPETEAVKKMRAILRRNQKITAVKLAERVGVSRQYAGDMKKAILADMAMLAEKSA